MWYHKKFKFIRSILSKFDLKILTPPSGYDHIFQMFTIRLKNKQIRDKLHKSSISLK